jgi:hypothetical protein
MCVRIALGGWPKIGMLFCELMSVSYERVSVSRMCVNVRMKKYIKYILSMLEDLIFNRSNQH